MSTQTTDPPVTTTTVRRKKDNGEAKMLMILAAIAVVGGGLFFFLGNLNKTPEPPKPPIQAAAPQTFDALMKGARNVRGSADAKITIIEFADVQCNWCRKAYNTVLNKYEKRKDIRIVFYHMPLRNLHEYAQGAANALEAAAQQGKFWEMYDTLFTGEDAKLRDMELRDAAKRVGLDVNKFVNDSADPKIISRVYKDEELGHTFKVDTTPTFYVRFGKSDKVTMVTGGDELKKVVESGGVVPVAPNPKKMLPPSPP